ncbi:MAG: hypothetical protein LQ343_006276 [Gyalolechia ehrenbergii]|nr:MAG: hypothetical protein LQ343_006276 [Gyalolechia ehrenbergii]
MNQDYPGFNGRPLPVPETGMGHRSACNTVSNGKRFQWRVKPQPFGVNFPEQTCVEDWKQLEQQQRDILRNEIAHATFRPIDHLDADEVEAAEFWCRGALFRCERFLKVDQTAKDPFAASQLEARTEAKFLQFDEDYQHPPLEAVQLLMARSYVRQLTKFSNSQEKFAKANKLPHLREPKNQYDEALLHMYTNQQTWPNLMQEYNAVSRSIETGKTPNLDLLARCLNVIRDRWKFLKAKFIDHTFHNERNEHLATTPGLLRSIPDTYIYMALDKNDRLLLHLDPSGIERTFGKDVKTRMERDTIFWFFLKPPQKNVNARQASAKKNMERNKLMENQCGTDHLGHWLQVGYSKSPPVETKDALDVGARHGARQKQNFLDYMESTVGTITRLLDYEFGYLEPELREQYREVYRESPKNARLPPTNPPNHEETYCLRALICNVPTDEHRDTRDWVGGLTGLVQLGDFTGKFL